jgi:hypothetical protein
VRILLTFSINPEKGDQLIKEGRIGETMESILEELQPEAAYFTDVEGTRGGFLVVDMEDASQMPAMTEPLLLGVGATVHMQPVMTPEDLRGQPGRHCSKWRKNTARILRIREGQGCTPGPLLCP